MASCLENISMNFSKPSRREFVTTAAAAIAGSAQELAGQTRAATDMSKNSAGGRHLPRLGVHAEGHFLQTEEGRPFFWLGDTAWQLIHGTTRDECSYYLRTRADQGFTTVQAVVLAELDGIRKASALGQRPFENENPAKPNEAYFDRVVEIVDEAANSGLYVALLPTWGDKLTAPWGAGPRIFRNDNLADARNYARYLATKLRDRSNVIWMLGGDRPARVRGASEWVKQTATKAGFPEDEDWTPIWQAMADGLAQAGNGKPLILYHPQGGPDSTSVLLKDAHWLSVNGLQSGHGAGHDTPVWELIARDYAVLPPKPTLDLEPNYEDHPYNPWPEWDPATGYYRDHDVRKQIYRSVFAGGCGVTYGHHAVWQFANRRNGVINHADRDWIDAMQRPAARQAVFLRRLIESRPFFSRIPDQGILASGAGNGGQHMQATRDRQGTYIFVYFPQSDARATLDISSLQRTDRRGWWYDPRTGIATPIEQNLASNRIEVVTPPYGPDWVLVIDDASQGYAPPGLRSVL
jgi:hypothetical protein